MGTMHISMQVVIILVILALIFDFMNGFHDSANSIATVVSTGVMKPQHAVIMAATFNFIAFYVLPHTVAASIGKGIIEGSIVDQYVSYLRRKLEPTDSGVSIVTVRGVGYQLREDA